MKITSSLFLNDIHIAAKNLLGCILVRTLVSGKRLLGKIVEVEVYTQAGDPSAHSYKGKNERNAVMFGPPGKLYVYFTYGMHYCCNIVCGPEGRGDAILIRALEPLDGIEDMVANRFGAKRIDAHKLKDLTNGPAKLCKAMRITKEENGLDLSGDVIWLEEGSEITPERIGRSTRIGISQATDHPWRYYIKNNPWVSRLGKGIQHLD